MNIRKRCLLVIQMVVPQLNVDTSPPIVTKGLALIQSNSQSGQIITSKKLGGKFRSGTLFSNDLSQSFMVQVNCRTMLPTNSTPSGSGFPLLRSLTCGWFCDMFFFHRWMGTRKF